MKSQKSKTHRETIILDDALSQRLEDFCARTTRARATVVRAVLAMFLGEGEEGLQQADRVLSSGIWPDAPAKSKRAATAEDLARHVVDGHPLPTSRKRKSG